MGKLPRHPTWLHLTLEIRIKYFLWHSLIEWLRLTNSCIWISRKLSRVKPLLVSAGKPCIGIKLNRESGVRIGLYGKAKVRVGLNGKAGVGEV